MTNEVKIVPEEIHLFHIDILESVIKETTNKKVRDFELGLAHSIMHNLKDQRIKIGLNIKIKEKTTQGEEANAHFSIDFHYQIEQLENFYKLNDTQHPIFSGLLIRTVLGLSISTARGIIYERLSNSNLRGIILPVLDPKKVLLEINKN